MLLLSNLETFIITPHIIKVTIKEDPPDEKNGRVIPVEGNAPQTTPQLSRV